MNDFFVAPDNVQAIDSILSQVTLISYNTDDSLGLTPMFNWVAFFASVVTIIGIIAIIVPLIQHVQSTRISRKRKQLILQDIIRHLFVNLAIVEILRKKLNDAGYAYGYPDEGIFRRLAFMPEDCNFHRLSNDADMYDRIHEMELVMRNYNISTEVACSHFVNPLIGEETRQRDLEDLAQRSVRLIREAKGLIQYFQPEKLRMTRVRCCPFRLPRFRKVRMAPVRLSIEQHYKEKTKNVAPVKWISHYAEVERLMREYSLEDFFAKYISYRFPDKHLCLIPFPER